MSDYDTIDDDIKRAKAMLAKDVVDVTAADAYTLLESFVAEIERLRADYVALAIEAHRCRAHNDLLQAGVEDCAKAVDEMQAEIVRLRAELAARDVDAEWNAGQHD